MPKIEATHGANLFSPVQTTTIVVMAARCKLILAICDDMEDAAPDQLEEIKAAAAAILADLAGHLEE